MRILVTAGPTREPLDPVRFLSNASSGRMGYAAASAAARRGHEVILVSGPVAQDPPEGVTVVSVTTALEMLDACLRNFLRADALIMTAAVCDWRPAEFSEQKLKKDKADRVLRLVPNPDILATLAADKGERIVVGFALETDDPLTRAREKLERKNCDLLVLNPPASMEAARAEFTLLTADGSVQPLGTMDKTELAVRLIAMVEKLKSGRAGPR
jgi:phosphopantothenoylcysteine decarboxylase/phosphopantothenate--cysteine ligase